MLRALPGTRSATARLAHRSLASYTGRVTPGTRSPTRVIPAGIVRPDYADDGEPKTKGWLPGQIEVKSAKDIEAMRVVGRLAREVLDAATRLVASAGPGLTTDEIDAVVHAETVARGAYPSPLNYRGFPKSCCTSVDEVICHGIPDSRVLRDGEIINIDVTCYYGGYHGDCSETHLVGAVDERGKHLVRVTHDAWQAAISCCRPGASYNGIGGAARPKCPCSQAALVRPPTAPEACPLARGGPLGPRGEALSLGCRRETVAAAAVVAAVAAVAALGCLTRVADPACFEPPCPETDPDP